MRDSTVTTAIGRYLSQRGTSTTRNTLILSLESEELKKFRVQANNFNDRTSTLIERSSDDSRKLERESDDAFSFPEDRDEAACNVSHKEIQSLNK